MPEQYNEILEDLKHRLDEAERCEPFMQAISKTLPNDSDETDYDKWFEGTKRFHEDNKDVFEAMFDL